MINSFRKFMGKFHSYILFREALREGLVNFFKRIIIQNKILKTKPIITCNSGSIEIRVLTWRKDYINLIWALKSFYTVSNVDYPLYIHDGGLFPEHIETLKKHFPNAHIIDKDYADKVVNAFFEKNKLELSKKYRNSNIATIKLWDYFIFSKADRIISIDSDIVFFKNPVHIIDSNPNKNYYNEDLQFAYSMSLEEIEAAFNIKLPAKVNSGLFNVSHSIFDPFKIEQWLNHDKLFNNKWVSEQTMHAMLAATHSDGVTLLGSNYLVSTQPGLNQETICKHYPGFFRPLFFQEGLPQFYNSDYFTFLE